ncbi:MAG: hypothetical protein LBK58_12985 [Prevotellaceae bacterium]|jgi:hypothetical protein|nr:hypothetical protein [Prevotellaceae bacterium]
MLPNIIAETKSPNIGKQWTTKIPAPNVGIGSVSEDFLSPCTEIISPNGENPPF